MMGVVASMIFVALIVVGGWYRFQLHKNPWNLPHGTVIASSPSKTLLQGLDCSVSTQWNACFRVSSTWNISSFCTKSYPCPNQWRANFNVSSSYWGDDAAFGIVIGISSILVVDIVFAGVIVTMHASVLKRGLLIGRYHWSSPDALKWLLVLISVPYAVNVLFSLVLFAEMIWNRGGGQTSQLEWYVDNLGEFAEHVSFTPRALRVIESMHFQMASVVNDVGANPLTSFIVCHAFGILTLVSTYEWKQYVCSKQVIPLQPGSRKQPIEEIRLGESPPVFIPNPPKEQNEGTECPCYIK